MCGLPVVATNVRGNNEVVLNGENGYLVNDTKELLDRLNYLILNKNLRQKMGKNAINNSKKYSLINVLNEMIKIYEKN